MRRRVVQYNAYRFKFYERETNHNDNSVFQALLHNSQSQLPSTRDKNLCSSQPMTLGPRRKWQEA